MNYDISFCAYEKCENKECIRHLHNVKIDTPITVSTFPKCECWEGEENGR